MRSAIRVFVSVKKYRLGDNAAGRASAVGVDGSGGSRLSVGGIGGGGEESSEEIH